MYNVLVFVRARFSCMFTMNTSVSHLKPSNIVFVMYITVSSCRHNCIKILLCTIHTLSCSCKPIHLLQLHFSMVIVICQFISSTSDWARLMFIYEFVCLCVVRLLFFHTECSCHVTHTCNMYNSIANLSYRYTCTTSNPAETTNINNVINIYCWLCDLHIAIIYIVTILHIMVDWCFC